MRKDIIDKLMELTQERKKYSKENIALIKVYIQMINNLS